MNVHDGIPFVQFGPEGDAWIINPMHVTFIKDLSKKECEARKTTHPSAVFFFIGGPEAGYCINGVNADYIRNKINKTMIDWKDKLAEKALLS